MAYKVDMDKLNKMSKAADSISVSRRWEILPQIADGKSIEEIEPPIATEDERIYFEYHKELYDEEVKELPEGVRFQFVPANDPDIHIH